MLAKINRRLAHEVSKALADRKRVANALGVEIRTRLVDERAAVAKRLSKTPADWVRKHMVREQTWTVTS
jgi:hypothetical protein